MDKIEEGRHYRHREDGGRRVRITRIFEGLTESPGIAFDIWDVRNLRERPWTRSNALDEGLFRECYRYDPGMDENASFELADAVAFRNMAQSCIEQGLSAMGMKNPHGFAELFVRLVLNERAIRFRMEGQDEVAGELYNPLTLIEIEELNEECGE